MKYSSIFAGQGHEPITSLKQMRKGDSYRTMGFFVNGEYAGQGELCFPRISHRRIKTVLQTEGVELINEYRRKGHGIHLYFALIATARKLGAKRIYSSQTLNDKSTRMWAEKLPKYFKVRTLKKRSSSHCEHPGCTWKHYRVRRYFIDFQENANVSIYV